MIKNYIKIAWRNLKRNKAYAMINITGLSLSMACGLLIFTLVSYHFSFDDFHPGRDRIYRIVTEIHNENISHTPGVPPPFAKAFRRDFTFADKTARAVTFGNELISIPSSPDNKKFVEESGVACVEPDFFDIFNFPLVQGDKKTALSAAQSALVTEHIAKKYFGTVNAIGKVIRVDNKTDFTITGILQDIPLNTDRKSEIYVSDLSMKDLSEQVANDNAWGDISSETHCFIRLKPGIGPATVEAAFDGMKKKYYANRPGSQKALVFKLQPLSDVHFNPDYNGYADKKYLWALALIGVFLIVTACVNFINLATAQAINRSREVGIRKVLGSLRSQLFWQFIVETALITLFALVVAFGLAQLGLPFINSLFKTELTLHLLGNQLLLLCMLLVFLFVVFLSGSYPGLVLSGFQPVLALKGKLSQKNLGGFSLRRLLVVAQFAISQILIIGTIVIASQMHYSKTSDLGFRKDGIVLLPVPISDSAGRTRMETLRNRLASVSGVENVSFCSQAPASDANNKMDITFGNRPKPELWSVNIKCSDQDYLKVFNLKLAAGRNLSRSDTLREFLVNETFVKKLNLSSPEEVINKTATINGKKALIVGVVRDFYNYSFRDEVDPVALFSSYPQYQQCAIQCSLLHAKPALASFEKIWNETYPEYVYSFQFLDQAIARFYELDDIMLQLI